MIAIANNLTTRNRRVATALKPRPAEYISGKARAAIDTRRKSAVQDIARQCVAAGAPVLDLNLQQRYDKPEVMEHLVDMVQDAVDCQLCLSANDPATIRAGLHRCNKPPIVNYISTDEERLGEILPMAANHDAEVVLFLADPLRGSNVEDMLKLAAVLVGAANEAGITNDKLLVDPGVFHITADAGQRHAASLLESLQAIAEEFDPPVRTVCWVNNISSGITRRLRTPMNVTFLSMLAGAGLSCAFVNALDRDTMRAIRLISVLRDGRVYSDSEAER
jgi:cobalamin-dependent methionine synthase I